ncbi:MAG: thioredoxin family protein [Hymenobacter sp.]|nr:MAG: thioredoxin family protein [Hymenobacter sp.]
MKKSAIFYHAGCTVCVAAEQDLLHLLDPEQVQVEVIHLGEQPAAVAAARRAGVVSVPALVIDESQVLHINFGATLDQVEGK